MARQPDAPLARLLGRQAGPDPPRVRAEYAPYVGIGAAHGSAVAPWKRSGLFCATGCDGVVLGAGQRRLLLPRFLPDAELPRVAPTASSYVCTVRVHLPDPADRLRVGLYSNALAAAPTAQISGPGPTFDVQVTATVGPGELRDLAELPLTVTAWAEGRERAAVQRTYLARVGEA